MTYLHIVQSGPRHLRVVAVVHGDLLDRSRFMRIGRRQYHAAIAWLADCDITDPTYTDLCHALNFTLPDNSPLRSWA